MNKRNCPCVVYQIGIPGPQGIQGSPGVQGDQGLPGTLIISAGTFFSTSFSQIPYDSPVSVNSGSSITGSGISLTGTTDILLENPGIYLVSYYIQGDPVGGIETVACSLKLNNVTVPGSIVQSVTSYLSDEVEPAVSNTCIIDVTSPGTILQLFNSSNSALEHIRWVDDFCSASITVLRLS